MLDILNITQPRFGGYTKYYEAPPETFCRKGFLVLGFLSPVVFFFCSDGHSGSL